MISRVPPKVGRNAPCPCGSGRKFKKCCLNTALPIATPLRPEIAAELNRKVAAHELRQRAHVATAGHVREPVHADFQGRKLVAVGSTLIVSRPERPWKTFHDFLIDYARGRLGHGWAEAEKKIATSERHPLFRMHEGLTSYVATHLSALAPGEVANTIATGDVAGFLTFAYDLFIVADNATLQGRLLRRIKSRTTYQGARHELFAAATMVRAGFTIEYEDERDGSRKHPELVARHKETAVHVAVEAKSRHRPGVLSYPGEPETASSAKMRHLFLEALAKRPAMPFVIFLDLNLPPALIPRPPGSEPYWIAEWERTLQSIRPEDWQAFSFVVCSNFPYHYGSPKESTPGRSSSGHFSHASRYPLGRPILEAIGRAVDIAARGDVPHEFPEKA